MRDLLCREVVEVVNDYLEGVLPVAERDDFEVHLVICSGCSAYLQQLRQSVRLAGRLGEGDVPPEVMDQLVSAFRDWRASEQGSG